MVAEVRLAEIWTYAVKSGCGQEREAAVVEAAGLDGDRRWMVVDEAGRFLSQRERPRMALLVARLEAGGLWLEAPGAGSLLVPQPVCGAARTVTVWRDKVSAADGGEAAAAWLSRALGAACRLVFQADAASRAVAEPYAVAGDVVSFADGFPILLTSVESLADLNARMAVPVGMSRFRPNLVVQGAPAWAEDGWARVRIGDTVLRVAKPCDRCVVTTIDQATGERPDPEEPLRTLKTFRRDARGRVLFGQNLVPEAGGVIRVGDLVKEELPF